ncbi:restriction endonuclease subunit S [Chryseobacterium sp.]|uniref:restriction endonuclease subunit S n=1 Tax=Chryseobacterium sp. TaxID=1871047 RepID=UPI002FC94D62
MIEGYKDSPLGEIPKSWDVVELSDLAEIKGRIGYRGYTKEDLVSKGNGALAIGGSQINKLNKLNLQNPVYINWKKYEESPEIKIEEGDIVFAQRGTLGRTALIELLPEPATINPSMVLIKNIKCNKTLLYYFLCSNHVQDIVTKISSSTAVPMISQKQIKEFKIPLPSLPEQKKIAEILSTVDEKIEVIDQQITETQALKKGLMQRLLTKGIGHTEFKESSLGMIPQSWEVVKFGDLISGHCYGPRFSSKDYSVTGNVKTIRGTDINKSGEILYQQVPTAILPNDFVENHKLRDGDLVMITTADCGLTGVYFDQGFPFIPSAYAVRIRLNEYANSVYFKFIFQTELAKNQVDKYIRKGTVANLPGSDILKLSFPTPPIKEQQKIADILNAVDEKLDVLAKKKTHYQELKQGLMQQLLTGKIRVKV